MKGTVHASRVSVTVDTEPPDERVSALIVEGPAPISRSRPVHARRQLSKLACLVPGEVVDRMLRLVAQLLLPRHRIRPRCPRCLGGVRPVGRSSPRRTCSCASDLVIDGPSVRTGSHGRCGQWSYARQRAVRRTGLPRRPRHLACHIARDLHNYSRAGVFTQSRCS